MTTPSIDFTSRDFTSIREDLISLIPQFLPEWTSRSDNDFGIVLLDLFAYTADNLHYYADRIANEAYLSTATQRSSVFRIARLLDYRPTGNTSATVTLQFSNSSDTPALLPAGTAVQTASRLNADVLAQQTVTFETVQDVTVPARGSALVGAEEGVTVLNEALGSGLSDGSPDQTYELFRDPIVEGSVQVFVDEGLGPVAWQFQPSLLDANPFDTAFTTTLSAVGTITIVFGDAVNGRIPPRDSVITADYRVGGGTDGNVPANQINRILSVVPPGVTVTNPLPATGGADDESTASIRDNAPASLLTLGRATTTNDYANLALTLPNVGKARAVAMNDTTTSVYIAPIGGGGLDVNGAPTPPFAALKQAVADALNKVKPANVTVGVLNPKYVPVNITVTVHVLPRKPLAQTEELIRLAAQQLFAFDNVIFADRITQTDIHRAFGDVDGVEYLDLTVLSRTSTGSSTISLTDGEIPVLGTLAVTVVAPT